MSIYFFVWGAIALGIVLGFGWYFEKTLAWKRAIVMFLMVTCIAYLLLPAFAIDMVETWLMLFAILGTSFALSMVLKNKNADVPDEKVFFFLKGIGAYVLVFIVVAIFSSPFFFTDAYANIIRVQNHGQKNIQLNLVSQDQALRVTHKLAKKKAADLVGKSKQVGLASITDFGEFYGDVVDGKAVWISPLVPQTFFRWLSTSTTPGYFMCSHVNVMDSELVEDKPISYGTSGFYLGHDLYRYLYLNGYINYSYGDAFFQLDDKKNPYYVVPLERPQIGLFAYYPEKWLVINAHTGKIDEYSEVEKLPLWVNRAFPKSTMKDRLDDWGCYSAGWWECVASGVGVIDTTPGMIVTMDDNHNMIYYTGTQFQNNKVSGATSGLCISNARTGESDFYRRSGVTEVKAKGIINGAVSNFTGWSAEDPVLIQLNGVETYFSVITDGSSEKKGYGLVSQRNRNIFGTGSTVAEAIREYLRAVKNNGKLTAFEGNAETDSISFEGLVVSIQPVVRKGETTFYLRIDTVVNKIFVVDADNPAEVATTNVGDPIKLQVINTEPAVIDVYGFDNLSIDLNESASQIKMTNYSDDILSRHQGQKNRSDLNVKIKGLSPEQVQQMLEILK